MSVRILAAYLREQGHPAEAIDATELILTDSRFQDASPLMAETKAQTEARIRPLLDQGIIPSSNWLYWSQCCWCGKRR